MSVANPNDIRAISYLGKGLYIRVLIRTYGYTYMSRRKLTLSIDENIIREIKAILASEGSSLSSVVEEFLGSLTSRWLEEMAEDLGLGSLDPLDPAEIPSSRPEGYDSARVVRELREQRSSEAVSFFE